MKNIFNQDFQDFLKVFSTYDVEYILIGGYAVILHGYNRTTGDLDIWVKRSKENYKKIQIAFSEFGLPGSAVTLDDFLYNDSIDVFTFGRPPVCIDIMTKVKGLQFDKVYPESILFEIDDLSVRLISYSNLIASKKASGRYKDLNDIEKLEEK
jgi:hypothetical protein